MRSIKTDIWTMNGQSNKKRTQDAWDSVAINVLYYQQLQICNFNKITNQYQAYMKPYSIKVKLSNDNLLPVDFLRKHCPNAKHKHLHRLRDRHIVLETYNKSNIK